MFQSSIKNVDFASRVKSRLDPYPIGPNREQRVVGLSDAFYLQDDISEFLDLASGTDTILS
jgi:hypothetical protein